MMKSKQLVLQEWSPFSRFPIRIILGLNPSKQGTSPALCKNIMKLSKPITPPSYTKSESYRLTPYCYSSFSYWGGSCSQSSKSSVLFPCYIDAEACNRFGISLKSVMPTETEASFTKVMGATSSAIIKRTRKETTRKSWILQSGITWPSCPVHWLGTIQSS